ncbi:hypothetical protein [Streptomyces sp. NPDC055189]
MKKPTAFAVFALITLGTLGITAVVSDASAAPGQGRSHSVEHPAGTELPARAEER